MSQNSPLYQKKEIQNDHSHAFISTKSSVNPNKQYSINHHKDIISPIFGEVKPDVIEEEIGESLA